MRGKNKRGMFETVEKRECGNRAEEHENAKNEKIYVMRRKCSVNVQHIKAAKAKAA